MRLLSTFFLINKEISLELVIKFNIEQDTKKLFQAIVADGGENVDRNPPRMRPFYSRRQKYITTGTHLHRDKQLHTT